MRQRWVAKPLAENEKVLNITANVEVVLRFMLCVHQCWCTQNACVKSKTLDFIFLHIADMKLAFWKVLPAFLYFLLPALPVQVINKLCEDCRWNKLSQTSHKKPYSECNRLREHWSFLLYNLNTYKHSEPDFISVWNLWVEKLETMAVILCSPTSAA